MIDISKQGKGALVQPPQIRDYRLEAIPGAVVLPSKFSLRDKVGKIKQQNGSSSCSSQATSYYAEVLNFKYAVGNTLIVMHDIIVLLMPVLPEHVIGANAKSMRLGKESSTLTQPFHEVWPRIQPCRTDNKAAVFRQGIQIKAGKLYQVHAFNQVRVWRTRYYIHFVPQL